MHSHERGRHQGEAWIEEEGIIYKISHPICGSIKQNGCGFCNMRLHLYELQTRKFVCSSNEHRILWLYSLLRDVVWFNNVLNLLKKK